MGTTFYGNVEYAYLAGIIDGEGCLTMYKEVNKSCKRGFQYHPLLRITNTCKKLLIRIKKDLGMGFICWTTKRKGNRKDVGNLSLNSTGLRKLLPHIKPYVFIKKEQLLCIEKALSLLNLRQNSVQHDESYKKLDEIYLQLRKLNKRGIL